MRAVSASVIAQRGGGEMVDCLYPLLKRAAEETEWTSGKL